MLIFLTSTFFVLIGYLFIFFNLQRVFLIENVGVMGVKETNTVTPYIVHINK